MSLKIIRAGLFDTVQDGGRTGYRHLGINPNGPMDRFSAQLANALLGKALEAPLLELHFPAATLRLEQATILCITGGDFTPAVYDRPLPLCRPVFVPAGSVLSFSRPRRGRWCYVAFAHDLDLQPWLGSVSTHTALEAGGFRGRPLQEGDTLPFRKENSLMMKTHHAVQPLHWQAGKAGFPEGTDIPVLKGPEWDRLSAAAAESFTTGAFTVTRQSNRMGYRLQGPALEGKTTPELVSSAVVAGTVQLLPSGQLIVLMADHQTTGGYPRIGHVTSTGLPLLAQQAAGGAVRFRLVEPATAEENLERQQNYLQQLKIACTFKMQNGNPTFF